MLPSIYVKPCTTPLQPHHFNDAALSSKNTSNEDVKPLSRRRPTLTTAQSVPLPNYPQSSAAIRQALWVSRKLSTVNSSDSPTESSEFFSHLRKERNNFIGGEEQQRHVHPTVTRRASMFVRRMSMAIPTLSADPVPQSVCNIFKRFTYEFQMSL